MSDTLANARALLDQADHELATVVRQRDQLQVQVHQLDRRLRDAQRQNVELEQQAADAELRATDAEQRAQKHADAVLSHTARTT